jgi:hypothetical protein
MNRIVFKFLLTTCAPFKLNAINTTGSRGRAYSIVLTSKICRTQEESPRDVKQAAVTIFRG